MMDFDYSLHIFRSPKFQSVVNEAIEFFTETPLHRLLPSGQFLGPGVYGLYYIGTYELYAKIAGLNQDTCIQPIYVGKAVPSGWRRARTRTSETFDLYQRLREHTRSIQQGANLDIDDFRCKFMILNGIESDLIVPVEAELIRRFMPLWNTVVDGFGNHDPGAGRYNQVRSEWDVLHPGRSWAVRLTGASPKLENVIAKVRLALA
jgi:Eco29kI restriction endonuclease